MRPFASRITSITVLPRAKEAALFRLPAQVQQAQLVVHLLRPALAENRDA